MPSAAHPFSTITNWSAKALAEAEAAHKMEVKRILQVKQAHQAVAQEKARKMAEKSRKLQAELQAKLQEMAAADAAATLAFTSRR